MVNVPNENLDQQSVGEIPAEYIESEEQSQPAAEPLGFWKRLRLMFLGRRDNIPEKVDVNAGATFSTGPTTPENLC